MAKSDMNFKGITNPRRVTEDRLKKAEEVDVPAEVVPALGGMSQSQFSKSSGKKNSGPPADLLKKHRAKD